MIKTVIVDVARTFDGSVVFLDCKQKMARSDRKDFKSPMVPEPGKWTITLMVRAKGGDRTNRENINVTMESPTQPCLDLEEFDKVELDGLEFNMMVNEKGQAMAFWRVAGVRKAGAASSGNSAHQNLRIAQ